MRVLFGQDGTGFLEQPYLLGIGADDADVGERARPQRRRGQAFGVTERAGQCRRLLEAGIGIDGQAGPVLRFGQGQQRVAPGGLVARAEFLGHLETAAEVAHRVLEGQQPQRPLPRRDAVVAGFVRVPHGGAHVVVVRQLVDVEVGGVGVRTLGGHRDPVVVAHPPTPQELAVDRIAHQGVVEGIAVADLIDAAEQPRLLGSVEGVEPLVRCELGRLGHNGRLALEARHGGRLEQVDHIFGQARDATGDEFADGFGWGQIGWYRGLALARPGTGPAPAPASSL